MKPINTTELREDAQAYIDRQDLWDNADDAQAYVSAHALLALLDTVEAAQALADRLNDVGGEGELLHQLNETLARFTSQENT